MYDSINYDMNSSSDILLRHDKIDNDVKFSKTFYLASDNTKKYEMMHINVKILERKERVNGEYVNCDTIYLYAIKNDKVKLIKSIDSDKSLSKLIIGNFVCIDPSWKFLSIPTGDKMLIYDISSISDRFSSRKKWVEKGSYIKIPFNLETISSFSKYSFYLLSDRIQVILDNMVVFYTFDSKCWSMQLGDMSSDIVYSVSNSGEYMVVHGLQDKIHIVNLSKSLKTHIPCILDIDLRDGSDIQYGEKYLISDGGDIVINRSGDKLYAISEHDIKPIHHKITARSTIMLEHVNLFSDISGDVLIFWDRKNGQYKLIGLSIDSSKIIISEPLAVSYRLPNKVYRTSTNGKVFIYVQKNNTVTINDMTETIKIPIIELHLKSIFSRLKDRLGSDVKNLGTTMLIGNLVTHSDRRLTDVLRTVFYPISVKKRFIMHSVNTLDIPILESYKNNNLSTIDVALSLIDDTNNVREMFNTISNSDLYTSKVGLVLDCLKDMYEYASMHHTQHKNNTTNNIESELSAKYIGLTLIYATIYYEIFKNDEKMHEINGIMKRIKKLFPQVWR